MMKNNQLFQRLGLGQLRTLITGRTAEIEEDGRQESGSLYDGEDSGGSDEEEVTMVLIIIFLASSHYVSLLLGS
jgi:hypothetical protein